MRTGRVFLLIVGVALAGGVFWFLRSQSEVASRVNEPVEGAATTGTKSAIDANPTVATVDNSASPDELTSETATSQGTSEDCASGRIRSGHPLVSEEQVRISPLLTLIPELDAYRGQSRVTLNTMVQSGDALAMYVLGMSYLREVKSGDTDDPVDFARSNAIGKLGNGPLSNSQIDLLDQGSRWLYEAALHGRLQALTELDQLENSRYGGPVQQGIIQRDSSLSEAEQTELNVKLSYYINTELTVRSHPAFDSGFFGGLRHSYRALALSEEEAQQFGEDPAIQFFIDDKLATLNRDREQAGLSIPDIPPPAMSTAEMYRAICGDDVEVPSSWQ